MIAIVLLYAFSRLRRRRATVDLDHDGLFAASPEFNLTARARDATAENTPLGVAETPTVSTGDAPIDHVVPGMTRATAPTTSDMPTAATPNAASSPAERIAGLAQEAAALARQGNAAEFKKVAEALHGATGGAGNSWATVGALGRILDPTEPLYQEQGDTTQAPATADESAGGDGENAGFDHPDASAIALHLAKAEDLRKQGDLDGAREILQTIVAESDGDLRERAQRMLTKLDE